LSYDEISDVLGCSRGAVEQRLHRAMVMLREIWKEKHDWLER
jgi:DNA-directed RNA polymerase specialized sigma24 family protein